MSDNPIDDLLSSIDLDRGGPRAPPRRGQGGGSSGSYSNVLPTGEYNPFSLKTVDSQGDSLSHFSGGSVRAPREGTFDYGTSASQALSFSQKSGCSLQVEGGTRIDK